MPLTAETTTAPPNSIFATIVASALLLALAVGGVWCAHKVSAITNELSASALADSPKDHNALSARQTHPRHQTASGPSWREISEAQQLVLLPLKDRWSSIGGLSKRRWLVLADRYPHMSESERTKLVSRMNTWASLSTRQRTQARQSFVNTKKLSAQELQVKWEEYQALSEAEKKRLAEQALKAKSARKSKQRKLAQVAPRKGARNEAPQNASEPAPALVTITPVSPPAPVVETRPVYVPGAMPMVTLEPLIQQAPDQAAPAERAQPPSHDAPLVPKPASNAASPALDAKPPSPHVSPQIHAPQ